MIKVEYKKEDIQLLIALLNTMTVTGFENIKLMTRAAAIIDSGIVKEVPEKPKQTEKKEKSGKEKQNETE